MNGNNPKGTRPSKKTKRLTRMERQLQELGKMVDNLSKALPMTQDILVEEDRELLLFQIKESRQGGYMALLKYKGDPTDQIAFGTGDSPVEALYGLEVRVGDRGYSDAKPYSQTTK